MPGAPPVLERRPRSAFAKSAIGLRAAALVVGLASVGARTGAMAAVGCLVGGAMLAALAMRPKAQAAPDALYSASADILLPEGRQRPGQLSVTASGLVWNPSRFSIRQGLGVMTIDAETISRISVAGAGSFLSVVIDVHAGDDASTRFLTKGGRRLVRALAVIAPRQAGR